MTKLEKDYSNCSLGKMSVYLGDYDDGDQYNFNITIDLEGLYKDYKPIKIKGRGIQELTIISEMFKDISEFIKKNL